MFAAILTAVMGLIIFAAPASAANGSDPLYFSCSAQMHAAFGPVFFQTFTEQTGIEVEVYVCSSDAAVNRLSNDVAELAGSAKSLYHRHQAYGYHQVKFAKDPLVLFTNEKVSIGSLTRQQIQDIFAGSITNWKAVGGKDHGIVTIIPGQHTGAYWNFRSEFMEGRDLKYDFMSYKSAMVVRAVQVYPYAISFITRAAVYGEPNLKVLKVNGIAPDSPDYPYIQTFSFVTKGQPQGQAKALIDFTVNGEGRKILRKKGVTYITD